MKYHLTLLTVCVLLGITNVWGQLHEETRKIIYQAENVKSPFLINPNHSFEKEIFFEQKAYPMRYTLRVVGGSKLPGRFAPRGEEFFRQQEFHIDDHLDSVNVKRDYYSLYFKGNNDPFERHAYNRISGTLLTSGNLTVELNVKRNKFKVDKDGDFGVELQVYYKKEGRHPDDVYDKADTVLFMPIPAGSGGFTLIKKNFNLSNNVATILLRVGGTKFSGECWVEAPRLYQNGKQVCNIPYTFFDKKDNNYNYWVGINLVTRSWPKWKLEFNGKTLFEGNIFDRASDIADFYITLPQVLSGKGNLKLSLLKEPSKTAWPYELQSLQLIEESARDYEVISIPRYVNQGDTTGILIEINKPNTLVRFSGGKSIELPQQAIIFNETGLHVVTIIAKSADAKVPIQFSSGSDKRTGYIEQIVVKKKDGVYLSSGDEVHIDKEYQPYDLYFKWYIKERVGNWYHFRPSYQWSGVRITNENVIRHYTNMLNKLHMPYAWQVEGRTLAASRINLSTESLQSPMFRGKQAHENDGGYYYWRHFLYNGLHSDIAARTRPYGGIFAKHRPIYTNKGIFIHYDPYGVIDMQNGANKLVANLSYSRGESTRHTGPSTMFRYLYQAGYEWLGAEQMYGPEDIIMSSLRGASRAYNKKEFGSLHAVQWGSFPFTDPKHAIRFYMSLAAAYIHGSSHINTEEGLWTDEYANDRYSDAGKRHMYAQHQLLDYIETHSRQGELNTKIAVMQGRNDAWKSFVRSPVWSQKDDKWHFNKALESFDLLKIFYPENIVDGCGPEGWFTKTPYGPVDILPIEASNEVLSRYKALIFLGWNSFNNADFIRIRKFVENGGVVLLTAAHLNSELQPDVAVKFPTDDTVIKGLLGLDYKTYTKKTEVKLGKGRIIYYPQAFYPSEDMIRKDYEQTMKDIASAVIKNENERGWIASSEFIDFSAWDSEDFRTLYALNIDWDSNKESRPAKLLLNNNEFKIDVKRFTIATIRCKETVAAMPLSNTSDILKIEKQGDNWIITCQTTGIDTIQVFNGETGTQKDFEIKTAGINKIEFCGCW